MSLINKKSIIVFVIVVLLLGIGWYAYTRINAGADTIPPPPTVPTSGEFSGDLEKPTLNNQWNLMALPYVPVTGQSPQPILTQLCKSCESNPIPTKDTYYPIYKLENGDANFVLYTQMAPETPTGFPRGGFDSKPGAGYWVYADQEDTLAAALNLENYSVPTNNYYNVPINTNNWTLVGNPYLSDVTIASTQITYQYNTDNANPKFKSMKLSDAIDQNIILAYTFDSQNFGAEWTKLTASDSINAFQGVLVKTLARSPSITFYKPAATQ